MTKRQSSPNISDESNIQDMDKLIASILTLGLKPLYERNIAYSKIIKDFRLKLPRPQNEAREVTGVQKEALAKYMPSMRYVKVIDMSTHQTAIKEEQLDYFFNQLTQFDYSFVFFRNYYKKRTQNLMRFHPKAANKNFHLIMLQEVLKDDPIHPIDFWKVFLHHLKYEWKLTSYFFTRKARLKKREILNKVMGIVL